MTNAGTATATAPEVPVKSGTALRFLLLEDSLADSELILHELKVGGFQFTSETVQSPEQFRQSVRAVRPDIILADYNLGDWRGLDALAILREEGLEIPLILVTGALGEMTAVDCIKQGAADYLCRPLAMVASVHPPAMSDARRTCSTRGPRSFSEKPRTDCIPPA